MARLQPAIREVRRYLHAHPEASGTERRTTAYLAERLSEERIEFRIAPDGRGLIADHGAEVAGGRIGLRADIDALRLQDEKTVVYRSSEANRMHACGHDAHTAMLWGATVALVRAARKAPEYPLSFRSIFQPSEETATGAREMIACGAVDGLAAILALHVDPVHPVGTIHWRSGTLTALCEEVNVQFEGRGGHGARPHENLDPMHAASQFLLEAYHAVGRTVDVSEPAVLSFGVFQAGINPNVIPDRAFLRGTLRSFDPAVSDRIHGALNRIANGIVETTGVRVTLEYPYRLPGVHNDAGLTGRCRRAAETIFGPDQVHPIPSPSMGGEDFAYYLDRVPGCMMRLGVRFPGQEVRPLHSARFDLDENALGGGARWLARCVLELSESQDETR